jgi:hypothetical protein
VSAVRRLTASNPSLVTFLQPALRSVRPFRCLLVEAQRGERGETTHRLSVHRALRTARWQREAAERRQLPSSASTLETSSSSQPVRSTSVTLWYHPSLPTITAAEPNGASRGSIASRMLHHVEHTARMTPHASGSHCRYSSTSRRNSGESSEPHRLCPAARPPPRSATPPRWVVLRQAPAAVLHGSPPSSRVGRPLGVALRSACG